MPIRLLSVLALLVALHAAAHAAVVVDFATVPAPTLYQGEQRGVTSAIDQGRLVLAWQQKHSGFHEAYFAQTAALPGDGTLVLRVARTGGVPLWTLSARVRDAKGEVFNFTGRLPDADGELRIPVQEGKHDGHWGGNPGTGVMQPPLALIGIAINGSDAAATAELRIEPITYEPAKP